MNNIYFLFFVLAIVFVIIVIRNKNRLIWRELFKSRDHHQRLLQEIIDIRKQVVIENIRSNCRLPVRMLSQNGEDLLLWKFFGRKTTGFYIDVGAYDGVGFSNTYFFEALGWGGILIEAVPSFYNNCLSDRPYSTVINAAIGSGEDPRVTQFSYVSGKHGAGTLSFKGDSISQKERIIREGGSIQTIEIPLLSLNEILKDFQGDIDFVSIDVEGSELDVLKGFDLKVFNPRVLVIEDNSNGIDTSVRDWLMERGYLERYRCAHNVFYTSKEYPGIFEW